MNVETFTNEQETYRRFTNEPFTRSSSSSTPCHELHVRIAADTGSVTIFLGNEIHSPREDGRVARWNCSLSELRRVVAEVSDLIEVHEARSRPAGEE